MAEAKTNMDIPTKDEYYENPLYEKDVSINVQNSTVRTASDTVHRVAPVVVTEDTITQQDNPGREASLRLRAVAKNVSSEIASLNRVRKKNTLRKYRKHSTYSPLDISVTALEGKPPGKNKWKRFWWAFFVHFTYPVGTIYVYLVNGRQCFLNMRMGMNGLMQITFTHILFILPLLSLLWALIDPTAMQVYGIEILVLWFSHFSRLLGIAVKYSHLNESTFEEFQHCTQERAEQIQADMMLPSGWFNPSSEQWYAIIERSEHIANSTIGLHNLTIGQGLKSRFIFMGDVTVDRVKALIKEHADCEYAKKNAWTCHESTTLTTDSEIIPVLEVSAGIMLLAMVSSDRLKTTHFSFRRTILNAVFLALIASTIGIWYRLGKGQAGGGDHSASGVFIFSIVYCSFW